MPVQDNYYDLVWSQDAFLHSGERREVVAEIHRVLVPGGQVVFTDPMADDNADTSALAPIASSLASARPMTARSCFRAVIF